MQQSRAWEDLALVLQAGIDRIILFGPPGTGKTYAAMHQGLVGPVERIICTEDITAAEVTGAFQPNGEGGWHWTDGPAIRAWRRGGRLVVDEVDRASGDVLSLLLAMTDTEGSARWHHPTTGEVVTPRNGFSVVMTTNLEDIDLLPPALRDRFPVAIEITAPTLRALEVLSPDLRGPALRAAQGEGARRLSLRTFMTFDRLRGSLDGVRAAEILFGENAHDFLDALRVGSL